MALSSNIFVVDDDPSVRNMVGDFLEAEGHRTFLFSSGAELFEFLKKDSSVVVDLPSRNLVSDDLASSKSLGRVTPDLIVTDLNMPELSGIDVIRKLQQMCPEIPIILITAYSSIDTAIEATRAGAYSYVSKPFKLKEFSVLIEKALSHRQLKLENHFLRDQLKGSWALEKIIGRSPAMQEIFSLIRRISQVKSHVLITGESGTGKELVAKAIHELGVGEKGPFVAINCTAIPENLLESELFGHVKGSFTGAVSDKKGLFEEADGGTLFLDEIGDLNISLQAKLLRVLQEKEIKPVGSNKSHKVNVRIISATHKDLKKAVKDENFREDLYYRLSVVAATSYA